MKAKKLLISLSILVLCALLLFGISRLTAPSAADKQAESLHETMMQLLPGNSTFTEEPYSGEDENITAVYKAESGFVVETTVQGYVDEIVLLVGVRNDGSISGLTVLEAGETDGLGQRILTEEAFLRQYLNTSGSAAVGENIDAISGATVTSKAVTRAVNSAAAFVTGADAASSATEWSG